MLSIRVFGELEVEFAGEAIVLPTSRRACSLLGWLAVHDGAHPRTRLAGLFWPDVPETSARASLRSAVWALRSALPPPAGSYLVADGEAVGLVGEGLQVDARAFGRLVGQGQLEQALALCGGELLYQFDEEWVFAAREEHNQRVTEALRALTGVSESAGDTDAAVGWARRWATMCPLDEAAGGALIRLLAQAGDVAAAADAYRRLQDRLAEELGIKPSPHLLRGLDRLRLSVLSTPRTPRARRPTVSERTVPPRARSLRLVGRGGELRRLRRCWSDACRGTGTAVSLSGEGGIGKTRLVEEMVDAARAQAALTAVGGADGMGTGPPLRLWSQLLGELVTGLGCLPEGVAWTADLAALAPGLAGGAPPRVLVEPQLQRSRFFEAVVELIGWACRGGPVLLVLEDLHWADGSSLELIAHLGRRIAGLPVLLLLTRRPLPPRPALDQVLGVLRARSVLGLDLELAPLGPASVRELARRSAKLTVAEAEQVVTLADGSPLLAVETARAFRDGDPATGLRGGVRVALSRLDPPARLFIELVAVAGRDLSRAEISALPLLPDPTRAATAALGADLLRTRGTGIGFRHQLLRDAVYHDVPDPVRARLHLAIGQMLRQRAKHTGTAGAAEIAAHLRNAGRDELALAHLVRAASHARDVAALDAAAQFLRQASQITPDDAELLVELAEVQAWRGLLTDSDADFDRALERITPRDSGALASAWLRRGRWLRGGICHPRESRRSYRSSLDALDRDPTSEPLARAEALAGMAWAEAVAGDPHLVDQLLRQVAEITAAHPAGDLLVHDISVARGHALLRAGQFPHSYGPLIAASAAAGRAGRPDMAYSCLINAASAAACAGDFERALDFADRCVGLVGPNGMLRLGVYTQSARVAILRRLNRLEQAHNVCNRAAELAEKIGLDELDGLVHHDRGLLALTEGATDTASRELARALELNAPVSRPLTRLYRAEALVRAGQPDSAETEIRAVALEPTSPSDFPDTLVARMSYVQGLIARARDDHPLAEKRLYEAQTIWRRRSATGGTTGEGYVAALIDLGRPPLSMLIEPDRELARVTADLARAD